MPVAIVATGLVAGEGVQLQRLPTVGIPLAEGQPVGQRLEVGAVHMDLELVARFRVETGLHVRSGDGRVDVHDEDGAVITAKDVEIVDIEPTVLTGQRRIKVMGHAELLLEWSICPTLATDATWLLAYRFSAHTDGLRQR